jgi:hypothetical protein
MNVFLTSRRAAIERSQLKSIAKVKKNHFMQQWMFSIELKAHALNRLTSSEPLAEVQRALLVVLVLHAPHPEAGGLLGLRKLREHYMSSWDYPEK